MSKTLLRCVALSLAHEEQVILNNISFELKQGEILAVVGESGSGKSSLLKALLNLLPKHVVIRQGVVYLKEHNLLSLKAGALQRIRGKEITLISQDAASSFCPVRTVGAQIYEAVASKRRISKTALQAQAFTLFERFNLADAEKIWRSYPFELSGGMNQRVAIIMALLQEAPIILADEIASALDIILQRQIIAELKMLRDTFNRSIILVSHDINLVAAVADTVIVLKAGEIIEYAAAQDLLTAPEQPYTQQLLAAKSCLKRI